MVDSMFRCCTERFVNGSVSYTLNKTVPEDWNMSLTKNGTVIVEEGGATDSSCVLSRIDNGYMLNDCYNEVRFHLESPKHGVSNNILCTDQCNSLPVTDTAAGDMIYPLNLIALILIVIVALLCAIGLLIFKFRKRCGRHDNGTDVEMQAVSMQDPDQNQNQNPDLQQNPDPEQDDLNEMF